MFWGYNRAFYNQSNLHFNGPEFDVTFYDLEATDRPTKFGLVYFNPATITIPQYNLRVGYFLTDNISMSLGIDHMKYVVTPFQTVRFSGVITENISSTYAGSYLNEDIEVVPELLQFEHTDGFNFVSLEFEWLMNLFQFQNSMNINWNFGMGGIWLATKTKVKILGEGIDNDFHVAGFSFAGKMGPRLEYKNNFFLLGEAKCGYATLPSVLVENAEPEVGDHNVLFFEYYITLGKYFDIKKRKQKVKL